MFSKLTMPYPGSKGAQNRALTIYLPNSIKIEKLHNQSPLSDLISLILRPGQHIPIIAAIMFFQLIEEMVRDNEGYLQISLFAILSI